MLWWVLLGILSILALLAWVPLVVDFEVHTLPKWQSQLGFSWGGLLKTNSDKIKPAGGRNSTSRKRTQPHKSKPRTKRSGRRANIQGRVRLALGATPYLMRFVRRLLAQTTVRALSLDCRVGLGDPADTGLLIGMLSALSPSLVLGNAQVRLEADFQHTVMALDGRGQVVLVPARYLLVIGVFLLQPATWRLVYQLVQA